MNTPLFNLLNNDSDNDLIVTDSDSSSSVSDCESESEICEEEFNFGNCDFIKIDINSLSTPPLRFPFSNNPAIHITNDNNNALDYFEYFINNDLVNQIVYETNKHAETKCNSKTLKNSSCYKKWQETNANELYVFLTMHILQGIVRKPNLQLYWTKTNSIDTPFIRGLMTYQRFQLLSTFLHFVDENTRPDFCPCPKLYKIWPIFEKINSLFMSAITPEQDVTVDESLMLYKGRLGWKQYLPLKQARLNIKFYMLCESSSGYIYSEVIHTGKDMSESKKYINYTKPTQIVLSLVEPLLDKGYCITTDSYFTSIELANILVKRCTDMYGTIKKHQKGIPQAIRQEKLARNDIVAFRYGKACIIKWQDKKEVILLSTIHNPNKVELIKDTKRKYIPQIIKDYSDSVGCIDTADQNMSYYPATKREKKYYKKVFFHLLDQIVWNSFVLYRKNGGLRNNLQFRLHLIDMLISKYHSPQIPESSKMGRPSATPTPLRLTERHFIEILPPSQSKRNPQRQCVVCCAKRVFGKRIRKETRYYCPDCDVGLCIPCFKVYHTNINYNIKN